MKQWIDSKMDEQLEALKNLIRIPSVSRGKAEDSMPLGRHVHDALHYTLALANRLGFEKTQSLDGYCGTVDYGEGDEMLMIMAHLDVVPAGTGWDGDPFEPVVKNGRLIGRGVLDDKGAAISALYALAAVKEAGIPLKRRVRLFFGCDEELGWACIDRYKKTEPMPTMAFTPDGDYPLVNSEMSICQMQYRKPLSGSGVQISCGIAPNVIPGEAAATLNVPAVPCKVPDGFTADFCGNTISVKGYGGHASQPGLAKNAMLCLLDILSQQPLAEDDLLTASALHALLNYDKHGEGFGLDIRDASGHLTLSPDMLVWDADNVCLTLDSRYPFVCPYAHLTEKTDGAFAAIGFTRATIKNTPGHFIEPDSELVKTLLSIYEENIGHRAKPLSIGGGTYARGFENAVAFGLIKEGEHSECHMPNESMALSDIRFNTVVMAEAIRKLAGK